MCRSTELLLLSVADGNKDLSCTLKITARQTCSWDRDNVLYRQCAKCCTTTFCVTVREQNDWVPNWSLGVCQETGAVWGDKEILDVVELSPSISSLRNGWSASHEISPFFPHCIYAQIYMCQCMRSLRQTPDMENAIQSIQIWWTFKQQNTESYNGR